MLKEKIKALKKDMKAWASLENDKNSKRRNEINSVLLDWDLKAELGDITEADRLKRDALLFDSFQLEHLERMDLKQKARVKWAVDGDENTNFFHVVVNYRCRKNKLKGLICDALWTSDPSTIQSTKFIHFAERFRDPIQFALPSFARPSRNFQRRRLQVWKPLFRPRKSRKRFGLAMGLKPQARTV